MRRGRVSLPFLLLAVLAALPLLASVVSVAMSRDRQWGQIAEFAWGIVGASVVAGGLASAFVAGALRDPSRGRARCPACWYSLAGAVSDGPAVCPECGVECRAWQDRFRTRRRWAAVIAASVGGPAAVWAAPMIFFNYPKDWIIPDRVLIWHAEHRSPGEALGLWPTLRGRGLSAENGVRYAFACTPELAPLVRAPAVWVAGEPVPVKVSVDDVFGPGWFVEGELRLGQTPQPPGYGLTRRSAFFHVARPGFPAGSTLREFAWVSPAEAARGVVASEMTYWDSRDQTSSSRSRTGSVAISPPRVVPSFEDLLPTSPGDLGPLIAQALKPEFNGGGLCVFRSKDQRLADVSVGVRIEVLHGRAVAARALGYLGATPGTPEYCVLTVHDWQALAAWRSSEAAEWRVRVVHDEQAAGLGVFSGVTSAWRGEVDLPQESRDALLGSMRRAARGELEWRERPLAVGGRDLPGSPPANPAKNEP